MKSMKLSFKRVFIAFAAIITLTLLFSPSSKHAYAEEPASYSTPFYADVNGEKVYVLELQDIGWYLFLPSETDSTHIKLCSDDGRQVFFISGEAMTEELDISMSEPNEKSVYDADIAIFSDTGSSDKYEMVHLNIMKGNNVGTVYYNSDNIADFGREWIDTNRENRGTGTALITDPDGGIIYDGVIEDIHIRGRTSIRDPKKGYQIKLSKKTALVGEEKGKKWLLLAMYKDPLRINDTIMKNVAKVSDDRFAADSTIVNLYYDGCYRGVYELSEKNEVKTNRVDITDMEEYYEDKYPDYGDSVSFSTAKNKYGNTIHFQKGLEGPDEFGGYLMEMNDQNLDPSDGFFFTANGIKRYVTIDSPELGSKEAVNYISEYFQGFVNSVYGQSGDSRGWDPDTGKFYYDYCDLDSLVNTYLLQTIASNSDTFWKSQYFYKDLNEIMYAGPIWDMDLTFGTGWSGRIGPQEDFCSTKMISGGLINIPSFRATLKERYFKQYQSIMASLLGEDDKVSSFMDVYETVKPNLLMDAVLWPLKYQCGNGSLQWDENESLDVIAEYRVDWIRKHKAFLDSYFDGMNDPEETAHVYGEPEYENEEFHIRYCKSCGEALRNEHVWDEGTIQKEANCTEEGLISYTCALCGGTKTVTVPVNSKHVMSHVERKEPTYEENGNTEYFECSLCKKVFNDEAGTTEIRIEDTVIPKKEKPVVYRFYVGTRYETALKAAEEFREQLGTDKLSSVIIACGTNYADALSGSYLSSVRKAPILLTDTKKDHIDLVRNYINDHVKKGGTVYLLGGPAVVPDSVKTGLGDFVVTRLWGADRYETNMAVLKEAGIASEDILVCSGMNFPDSLSAAAAGSPIILVKNEIQSFQKEYLQDLTGKKIYIIGGEGAVNEKIFSSFEAFGTVERIGGTDRYETSALFADKFFDNCEGAVLAYGKDFPDGLCGGALANIKGVPLLLTAEGKIDAARSFIAKKAGSFIDDGGKIKADILGGPALISDENALTAFGIENVGKVVIK